jgi:hypothetical protein
MSGDTLKVTVRKFSGDVHLWALERFLTAAVLLLRVAQGSNANEDSLPVDVTQFIENRDTCDHFRGEPYEHDESRRAFVEKQLNTYCTGTDTELVKLKQRYSDNPPILRRLNSFETCVEAQSQCR